MGGFGLPFVFQEQMVCLPRAHHPFPQGRSFYFNESTLSISPSKFGVNIPLPKFSLISSIVQKRPPSSSSLGSISPSYMVLCTKTSSFSRADSNT